MKLTLNPGVYVIKNGGWNVNGGDWTGTGVTFYYADNSGIQFNSSVKANITAPTDGDYKGILITESSGQSGGRFILNDNKHFDFEGVIHLPSREVVLNGGAKVRSRKLALVADSVIINTAKIILEPVEGQTRDGNTAAYLSR